MTAVAEAVCEWPDDASADVSPVLSYPKVSIDALDGEEVLERIMTQKWISNFLVGIESWWDVRGTGFGGMGGKARGGEAGRRAAGRGRPPPLHHREIPPPKTFATGRPTPPLP